MSTPADPDLRTTLHRLADAATPLPVDDDLWQRGQAARRRGQALAVAAVLVLVASVGGIATLVQLAGGADNVVAIADFAGAQEHGVRFTGGSVEDRPWHALSEVAALIEAGSFSLPVAHVLPLSEIAEAHRLSESGHAGGKIVLTVD